jgi:tRNA pseudouridine38-40 synthase
MHNIRLIIAYDGTDFSGFELQPGRRTVRGELQKALQKIYKRKISVISSSRTDAGVHALKNVVNFQTDASIPAAKLALALNACLPEDICVLKAVAAAKNFNARFDAKSKEYEYLIYNGRILPPLLRKLVWHVKPRLNLSAMRKAAGYLIGKHDFSSFCAAGGDDRGHIRIIHSFVISHSSLVIWKGSKLKVISLRVIANGFLYKMVRNIVGTLVDVGLGKIGPLDVKRILLVKDRKLAGRTAPAQGLCLIKVKY